MVRVPLESRDASRSALTRSSTPCVRLSLASLYSAFPTHRSPLWLAPSVPTALRYTTIAYTHMYGNAVYRTPHARTSYY